MLSALVGAAPRLLDLRRVLRCRFRLLVLRAQARAVGAAVEIHAAPDVAFGRRVRVSVRPRTRNRLELGPGCTIDDDVELVLQGGTVRLGPKVWIRRGTSMRVAGTLELAGSNVLSYHNVIHCSEGIRLGRWACTNEFVTLVDSRHFHGGPDPFFYENLESAPITIGENVWIANKSSVLLGVTIGDEAIVSAGSVVTQDVPAGWVVAPARPRMLRRQLRGTTRRGASQRPDS
jgi:acetyltransferase-like isoleucine patch superfamily enzyme